MRMSTSEDEGPRIVWTFPLMRMLQDRSGLLNIGSNIGKFVGSAMESSSEISQGQSATEDETVEDEIDGLKESSNTIFSSSDEDDSDYSQLEATSREAKVSIEDGVFVPQRIEIDQGQTVEWTNENDSTHSVMAIEGEDFNSGPLSPGESFEHTFEDEGATIYVDSVTGGENMSGAVLVGDVELESDLPSEQEVQREFFESRNERRSMSQAAQEKQEMRGGF